MPACALIVGTRAKMLHFVVNFCIQGFDPRGAGCGGWEQQLILNTEKQMAKREMVK